MIKRILPIYLDFENHVNYIPAQLVKGDIGSVFLEIKTVQDIIGHTVRIAFQLADGTKYLSDCTTIDANTAMLSLPNDVMSVLGRVECQIAVYDDTTRLTSALGFHYVVSEDLADAAVEASDQYPILMQLITDTQNMLDQYDYLQAQANDITAKYTSINQTYSDFLAQLGTDVATLDGNGKLTPSQIPALALQDIFTISSEAELIGLDAQMGDFALIIPDDVVEDFYILAGNDPAIADNWKKGGMSYIAEAGHAVNADEAINATKINNKRLIAMTQAEYDIAVLDPDTIYVVTP